jgi:2,4-dienoyl-CoA reductase-like NADH-dependent reductase (Old Yellow Enzyme family)
MSYDKLLEPLQIGDCELKNRIAMSPMNMTYSAPFGYMSLQSLAWYATRAKGGFGLIITECVVVNPHRWRGCDGLNPALFTDVRQARHLSELVNLIHTYDRTRIFIQLSPGWGRQGHPNLDQPDVPSAAPSPVPMRTDVRNLNKGWERQVKRVAPEIVALVGGDFDKIRAMSDDQYALLEKVIIEALSKKAPELMHVVVGETPRELTRDEIVDLEDRMAAQAEASFKLGFDGVEIHSPHGYLIHQFLSPRMNLRHDEYGGSLENRGRFLVNIIRKIRARVGPDKPVGARFSGDEKMPGGLSRDEARQFVAMAAEAGLNYVNISQGCYENPGAFAPDGEDEFTQYGSGFKQAGGVPVITPGFINPETANEALQAGHTDVISLGRQAIADPYWPAKTQAGREKDIVKCLRCNHCYMNLFEPRWITCKANPTAGFEKFYPELWIRNSPHEKKAKKFMDKAKGLL